MSKSVFVLYGWDQYYPPAYGVIGVYESRDSAESLAEKLRESDVRKIDEDDGRFPPYLRGTYAGLYERIEVKEETLRGWGDA